MSGHKLSDSNIAEASSSQKNGRENAETALSADLIRLREMVSDALVALRSKQKALQKSRDIDYNVGIAQQVLRRIAGLHSEIQKIIDAAPIADGETLSDIQAKSEQIQTQLSDLAAHWAQADGILPNKKALKKCLREILFQLQVMLSDINAELASLETADQFVDINRDVVSSLISAIEQERRQIEIGDFGRPRKSEVLEQIHLLALQIYRFRQLTSEPHLRKKIEKFKGIALQIRDTVNGLDIEEENAAELLDSSTYVLERQLCQLEFNGRMQFFFLPAGWLVNRYKDVTRLKSVQSRVLSGLALSLMISGVTFILCTVMLTAASALASASQNTIREEIETEREAVANGIRSFIALEDKQGEGQIRLANIRSKIDTLQAQIERERERAEQDEGTSAVIVAAREELNRLEEEQAQTQDIVRAETIQRETKQQEMLDSMEVRLAKLDELVAIQAGEAENQPSNRLTPLTQVVYDVANFVNQKELFNHSRRILLAAFSGAVGSMMSILIRLEQMDKENIKNPFLLGAMKPLLGAVFGVSVFAILSTGVIDIFPASFSLTEVPRENNLPSGATEETIIRRRDPLGELDAQEMYTIFLVAFIAGFSERLANDTLKSVGSKSSLS